MTARVLAVVTVATSLAALIARAIALALTDIDRGLRDFRTETPNYVPLWMDEEADL